MLFQTSRLSKASLNMRSPKNSELSFRKRKGSTQDSRILLPYSKDPKRSFFFNKHVTVLKTGKNNLR